MTTEPELLLPADLRSAACKSGNEWGWKIETIPRVIDEAEKLGLLNLGGQLQFLLPVGTCECYWVSADPLSAEPEGLNWNDRVVRAASEARRQMIDIHKRFDFIDEGRRNFAEIFDEFEAGGGNLGDRMWFIWYLRARDC